MWTAGVQNCVALRIWCGCESGRIYLVIAILGYAHTFETKSASDAMYLDSERIRWRRSQDKNAPFSSSSSRQLFWAGIASEKSWGLSFWALIKKAMNSVLEVALIRR